MLMLVRAVVTVPVLKIDDRSEAEVVVEVTDARLDTDDGGFRVRAGGGGAVRRIETGWGIPEGIGRGDEGSGGITVLEGETSGVSVGGVTVSLLEGSFGGSDFATVKSFSQSCVEDCVGLERPVAEMFSKERESSMLSLSRSPVAFRIPFCEGPAKAARFRLEGDAAPSILPSEDRDTEWKDEVEDA